MASEQSFPTPLKDAERRLSGDPDNSSVPHYRSCPDEAKLREGCDRNSTLHPRNQRYSSVELQQNALHKSHNETHLNVVIMGTRTRAGKRARTLKIVRAKTRNEGS